VRTIYVDELFLLNMVINYILLAVTKRVVRAKASPARLLLGSAAGAVYAVFLFLPHHWMVYSFAAKIAVSLAITAMTYGVRKFRLYLRTVAVFYTVSFAFGGAAYALLDLTDTARFPYPPLKILALSTVAAYAGVTLLSVYRGRLAVKEQSITRAAITVSGKTAAVRCFLDTGNALRDPFSDSPVMVVEYARLANILPPGLSELVKRGGADGMPREFQRRLRLIPYSAVGKKNGVIIGFKPDRVTVGELVIADIVVGLCEDSLSRDDAYAALANPIILEPV
jgi:stage II sporulation protein GA (sporulation sigma-E factor processing peptidase)